MDPIPLSPPYAGIKDNIPLTELETPYCQTLLNFNITQKGLELRNGDSKYALLTNGGASLIAQLIAPFGDSKCFTIASNSTTSKFDFFDVEAGTVAFSSATNAPDTLTNSYFDGYLYVFAQGATNRPGWRYDGSTWSTIGYTGTGTFNPFGGVGFNHRNYLVQYNEAAYWYSGIDAVSGAMTKVDLTGLTNDKCTLSSIGKITLSDQVQTDQLIAFLFSNGEVLFYSGSYPGGTDWGIRGQAQIGQPLNYGSVFKYQGDTIALCDTGVVSLRDLFLKGSEAAASLTVNSNIQSAWQKLVSTTRSQNNTPTGPLRQGMSSNVRGVWDQKNNRLVIGWPVYNDTDTTVAAAGYYFVFNTIRQAWSTHKSFGGNGNLSNIDLNFYKNRVLPIVTGSNAIMVWEKEGASNFTDRRYDDLADVGFDYTILSAPISNGRTFVTQATGLDVIMQSDMYAQTNFQFVRDFGVDSTTSQTIVDQGTNLQKPFVDMGIVGSYIQYKISGTTVSGKSTGLKLYGTNIWLTQGGSPR